MTVTDPRATAERRSVFASPVGPLTLIERGGALGGVLFPAEGGRPAAAGAAAEGEQPSRGQAGDLLAEAARQLAEYFAGERRRFDLPLDLRGTSFQRRVWAELRTIPYGETVSYGELARRIGKPGEAREVGGAVGRTPTPIVVPCHRVIGADGALVGYGGGLPRKRALLDLEQGVLPLAAAGTEEEWTPRTPAGSRP
jgi:methylated-DNA-[protein]-cysteine S-methyltransferase